MESSINAFQVPAVQQRERVPLSEIAVHLVEQREAVLRHLLFWMQEQTYYRQRWHRRLAEIPIFDGVALISLERLRVEIDDASSQFPYGFDPADEACAEQLSSRLRLLACEVSHLKKLCGAYVARSVRLDRTRD